HPRASATRRDPRRDPGPSEPRRPGEEGVGMYRRNPAPRLQVLHRMAISAATAMLMTASLAIVPAGVSATPSASTGGCQLQSKNGSIKHVIQIQFDNTHFR